MPEVNNEVFPAQLRICKELVNERLNAFFTEGNSYAKLLESMRYSMLSGGKRIRAVLCMMFCQACGGSIDLALDAACAIEMLHAYSLIHDDLPCMDDDDLRRGKPSNHIAFGEATAVLAGDALQAAAFNVLLNSDLPNDAVVEMGRILANAAGPDGICGGQYLDIVNDGSQIKLDELKEICALKTQSLISAAARIGVVAANGSSEQVDAAGIYASNIGFVFQVRDDVLDQNATVEVLGKPIGSDKKNMKTTFADIMSESECERVIRDGTNRAVLAIADVFDDAGFLTWFAHSLAKRKS